MVVLTRLHEASRLPQIRGEEAAEAAKGCGACGDAYADVGLLWRVHAEVRGPDAPDGEAFVEAD